MFHFGLLGNGNVSVVSMETKGNFVPCIEHKKYVMQSSIFTLAISSGERAPCMSCLFARISNDAPDSLCHGRER